MNGSLLMSDQDLLESSTLQFIEERKNGAARVIEKEFHPLSF
jgi:hypothetical protein